MKLRLWQFLELHSRNIAVLMLALCLHATAQDFPMRVTTIAGGGIPKPLPALQSAINPANMSFDGAGNLFFADRVNNNIRKLDATGTITAVAGNRTFSFSGDDGPPLEAGLNTPNAVVVDSAGDIYIADRINNRIRKIDHNTQIITTFAGKDTNVIGCNPPVDGIAADLSNLCDPAGLALDSAGNLLIADRSSQRIRKVDHATHLISTVAGTGVPGFSGDGGPAAGASLWGPSDVAVDASGNIFIADTLNSRVRKIDATGIITTVAGNGGLGSDGDGGPATSASLFFPISIALSPSGALFITDESSRVRKVDGKGIITTAAGNGCRGFTGDGGLAINACLGEASTVAVDSAGNLLIGDGEANRIRMVDKAGVIRTIAGNGEFGFGGDGGPASEALFFLPTAAIANNAGNLLVADNGNHRIRRVDTAGTITTLAGIGGFNFSGVGGAAVFGTLSDLTFMVTDASGNLIFSQSGSGKVRKLDTQGFLTTVAGNGTMFAFSGDGGPAVNAAISPAGLAIDAAGNLLIADSFNNRIRKVDTNGIITTIAGTGVAGFFGNGGPATAAEFNQPLGIALDAAGNLFVADSGNSVIRKIDVSGNISSVLGLTKPTAIVVDPSGNLIVSATFNNLILKMDANGSFAPIAGTGDAGYSGDQGDALKARFNFPEGLSFDRAGNLIVTDTGNERIRKLVPVPLAREQNVNTRQDQPVSITLSGASPRGNVPLTFSIVTPPAYGTLSNFVPETGAVLYTPAPGFNGGDQFTFKVTDGVDESFPGTVSVFVQPLPDFQLIQPSPTIRAGESITFTFTALAQNGFNTPISFDCADLPPFATCTFSAATTTPDPAGTNVTVRIQTSVAPRGGDNSNGSPEMYSGGNPHETPPGLYTMSVVASAADGSRVHNATLVFTVISRGNY